MIAALRKPALRITAAVALSVLLHSSVMWAPDMRLPRQEAVLPPLTARLEPLMQPPPVAQPVPEPAPKSAPERKQIAPSEPEAEAAAPSLPEAAPAPAQAEEHETAGPAPAPAPQMEPAVAVAAGPIVQHPLPRHAQLDFAVYQGSSASFMIGEVHHTLEIAEGRYTLKSVTQTTGLASMFKRYLLTQTSRGIAGNNGLQPEMFEEERVSSGSPQKVNAMFDWPARTLRLSQGGEAELPPGAQDVLSMLYQLSQLPMYKEVVQLAISNGRKLDGYELEIGKQEEIITPLGKLRALHLRKVRAPGEEGFEIWLGLEYRMLPVKFRHVDRSGEADGEALISGIRVADE